METLTYWESLNEKIVELYVLLKHGIISKDELEEIRLSIRGRIQS